MTDQNVPPTATPTPAAPESNGRRRDCKRGGFRRRGFFVAGILLLTGLVGFGIGKVSGGRHFGSGYGMNRSMDTETMMRRVDTGVGRLLGRINGTPDQKAKIVEIAKATIKDLTPLRDTHRVVQGKLAVALKAEKIDRAVVEQLRVEEIGLAETFSKRASQALADAAEVLTPAQRAKLIERWQARS
jgi:periplasmic protein CpxP/Spy